MSIVLAGQIEHVYCLMADERTLDGIAHVAIGDEPGVFSKIRHIHFPFGY